MPDEVKTEVVPVIPIEKVLSSMEEMHRRASAGMSICDILGMAHDAFHIVAENGDRIAALARVGLQHVN